MHLNHFSDSWSFFRLIVPIKVIYLFYKMQGAVYGMFWKYFLLIANKKPGFFCCIAKDSMGRLPKIECTQGLRRASFSLLSFVWVPWSNNHFSLSVSRSLFGQIIVRFGEETCFVCAGKGKNSTVRFHHLPFSVTS